MSAPAREEAGGPKVAPAPRGNVKVTREDWITVATDVLISQGADQVKVLDLSARLEVSRSSFYWYFKSRQALLDALLENWRASNTGRFVDACEEPAETITGAVCNLFRRFIDPALFDPQLDFA
ncbi:MAG: TetR/AcrR family transcriptional regulator, partial [Pseudomonadota bacterium]